MVNVVWTNLINLYLQIKKYVNWDNKLDLKRCQSETDQRVIDFLLILADGRQAAERHAWNTALIM